MKVIVTRIDCAVGRCVADRLVIMGHDVIAVARRRPVGWPGSASFVHAGDRHGFASAVRGADAAMIGGPVAQWQAAALVQAGVSRIVAISPAEGLLARSGLECLALRCGLVLGRDVDDDLLAAFTAPAVFSRAADRPVHVVHPHDVADYAVRCVLGSAITGSVSLIAEGHTSVREITAAVGRRVIPARRRLVPADLPGTTDAPDWRPVWTASECVADFALTARGRIGVGGRVYPLPWRLARVRDVPAVDTPADDGVEPVDAGMVAAMGEFDTPIDPRFPAFAATNLSEALPGPFTPSSASVTVRGTRAAGMVIAERLRPGGLVQREMATRTTGVFGHRLYAGMTSASFMAGSVPFVKPEIITTAFFGQTSERIEVFGDEWSPQPTGLVRQLRNLGTFTLNLVGLSLGSRRETYHFIADVDSAERQARLVIDPDDAALRAHTLSVRDLVVQGWVVSSASILVCTAYGVMLRLLCGRDITAAVGREVVSAQSLGAVHRLARAARQDPAAKEILGRGDCGIGDLAAQVPDFHRRLLAELEVIGHRGPAEVEMQSHTYADDPGLVIRMVAKTLYRESTTPTVAQPQIAWWARPIAAAAAAQLRDREVRRDKLVRAIWVLRGLLRECGARLAAAGRLEDADDVFFLQVDEIASPADDLKTLVAGRRAERQRLSLLTPPDAFSRRWEPALAHPAVLGPGDQLQGLGVCGGQARGRVRVVAAESIGDLQPGEVLVAKVTDVGFTPVFAYAAAVLTELGGPISHAAIIAREYGISCVVNARDATSRLPDGALIEVDGVSGKVRVLDL